jgi:mono/diheme cytochrome c family protein
MNRFRKLWLAPIVLGAACLSVMASVVIGVARPHSSPTAADARSTFNAKCVRCHGRDGRGRTAQGRRTHARDLSEAGWQNDVTDERLFNSILNGRGKMPSYKKSLKENQIDELVNYVRQLRR